MPDASRPVGDLTDDQIRKRLRVPIPEAAHLLGISPEAVRSRLYRGTLDKETGTDGTVYVRLHADQLRHDDEQTADQSQPNTELVGELRARVEDRREQIGYLQGVIATRDEELRTRAEELRRRDQDLEHRDRIIAALTERIPQALEAPPDERESPEIVGEEPDKAAEPPSATVEDHRGTQRPWWRKWFGG
jgi:hypothetical protein